MNFFDMLQRTAIVYKRLHGRSGAMSSDDTETLHDQLRHAEETVDAWRMYSRHAVFRGACPVCANQLHDGPQTWGNFRSRLCPDHAVMTEETMATA